MIPLIRDNLGDLVAESRQSENEMWDGRIASILLHGADASYGTDGRDGLRRLNLPRGGGVTENLRK